MPDNSRLIPHTTAWFDAMLRQDTAQALHVMGVIHANDGRLDCCTVCGDEPAPIYRLVKPRQRPEWVQTMRLCADCVGIRRDAMGETFELIL